MEALVDLAGKLLDQCEAGNLSALQELGNRLEGKAVQGVELSGTISHAKAEELTDDVLADIATSSSTGITESAQGQSKPH